MSRQSRSVSSTRVMGTVGAGASGNINADIVDEVLMVPLEFLFLAENRAVYPLHNVLSISLSLYCVMVFACVIVHASIEH